MKIGYPPTARSSGPGPCARHTVTARTTKTTAATSVVSNSGLMLVAEKPRGASTFTLATRETLGERRRAQNALRVEPSRHAGWRSARDRRSGALVGAGQLEPHALAAGALVHAPRRRQGFDQTEASPGRVL